MTGYGEAALEGDGFALSVDVRTFNNRFLKLSSKVPEEIAYIQSDLEEAVRKRLDRGSVFFTVRFEPSRLADLYDVDEELVKKYADSIHKLSADLGTNEDVRVQDLLLLPGAIHTEEALLLGKDRVLPVAIQAMNQALDEVSEMRKTEGRHLTNDLRERNDNLRTRLGDVKAAAPAAIEEHFHKLEEKVRKLLSENQANLSSEDVVKEAAILAERSDISEEIARLESHFGQFAESLESDAPVGRKLEFIVQEMLRESNTMGAKAANGEINRHVVEIKAEVDRLKEQVLNIE